MRLKRVFTWSTRERKLRLFRLMWEGGTPGQPGGYGAMLSVALMPFVFQWSCALPYEWRLTLCGVRLHYKRGGGRCV
jgi:hypothetical protein